MPKPPKTLRNLPSVDALLREPALVAASARLPRTLVTEAARAAIDAARRGARSGDPVPAPAALAAGAARAAHALASPQLRRVLNATGVVLHTNLGRAPLAAAARDAVMDVMRGYSSLELDLETGRRGERGAGIERWIVRLTGADAALAVNNGAGAILLALSALAAGRRVLVSRGELVEIGGSFRVPDVMEKSGARLEEVGTTNRTHLRDYERALAKHDDIGAILRVHPSNFRVEGFTARADHAALAALARKRRVPLIEDLGSGALVDLAPFGLDPEPTVAESLTAGSDVVTFSGDKLLGGAQAGIVVGRRTWIDRVKKDPLARALRPDKLALAALEATLALYADPDRARREVPTLAMLLSSPEALAARAERLARMLATAVPAAGIKVSDGEGEVGGGSLPRQRLRGKVVTVTHPKLTASNLERLARSASPPVIGTLRSGAFRLDPRTLAEDELALCAEALAKAWTN